MIAFCVDSRTGIRNWPFHDRKLICAPFDPSSRSLSDRRSWFTSSSPSPRALVKVLLLMLLAPVWAIPAWSSENGEPVVSNELAAEFAAAAEWIRSGDYLLARENADAGVDVPIVRPYVLEIEDNWRQARKTASGSGLSFCVSAQNQLQEIDAELTPLRPLVAGAVARLLNVQTNTLLNLNTQAMLNLVSDNQDMHAALERLRFLLMSVRQFEEDASLLWRATWACETGTFRLDGWGFAAGETQIAQMSLNTVIRSLLDSGVKDFVFNGTMLPPLKLARLKLDSISIENSVVQGLEIDDFSRARIDASVAELGEERDMVRGLGLI